MVTILWLYCTRNEASDKINELARQGFVIMMPQMEAIQGPPDAPTLRVLLRSIKGMDDVLKLQGMRFNLVFWGCHVEPQEEAFIRALIQ